MDRPKIFITTQYEDGSDRASLRLAYAEAIISAGGMALALLPSRDERYLDDLADTADALLLTGGDDVAPELYGEERGDKCGLVSHLRDDFEIKLARLAQAKEIPTLGICRGIQVMNVAFGGSLYQHLEGHIQKNDSSEPFHFVALNDSVLTRIYPKRCFVNSFHHQAVKRVGEGLGICGVSEDGTVEALVMQGHPFFVGVQWHPELMTKNDTGARRLFEVFVDAARINMKNKKAAQRRNGDKNV